MLAEVLQGPFSPFWRLQKFCKGHFLLFGVCRSPAKAIFSFLTLAEVPQTPLSTFSCLRKFRKRHFLLFDACGSSANTTFLFFMLAEVPQTPLSPFWRLQKFCKGHFLLFGACRSSAKTFSRGKTPHAFVELTYRRGRSRLRRRLSLAPIPNDDR